MSWKSWKESYPYKLAQDWLLSAGRTGRLPVDETKKDVPVMTVTAAEGGADHPVVAVIQQRGPIARVTRQQAKDGDYQ